GGGRDAQGGHDPAPPVEHGGGRGGHARLALPDGGRPALGADLLQLFCVDRLVRPRCLPGGSLDLELLGLLVGKGQEQLPGGADPQRQGPTQFDEWSEHLAAFGRGDADADVPLPDVQVDALVELVTQASHRLLGDPPQVVAVGGGLTPVEETGAQGVQTVLGAADYAETGQLAEQAVGGRLRHVQGVPDLTERHWLACPAEAVDQVACLLQDGHVTGSRCRG